MADSAAAASGSNIFMVESGSDPPDIPSTNVSIVNRVEGGNLSKEIKEDEEENKSVDEVKDEVEVNKVHEKDGVDKKEVEEVKDVQEKKSVENKDKTDEMDLRNTADGEENKDSREVKDHKGTDNGEENKEGIGETMNFEGQKDEKEAMDEQVMDVGVESKEVVEEKDFRETMHFEGRKDAKESKEENKDDEKEKGFVETNDVEGVDSIEEIKHDDEENAVKGAINATRNNVTEVREDIEGKNDMEVSDNVKDGDEKNGISGIIGTGQNEDVLEEDQARKDDNNVGLLKDSENKQGAQEINYDERRGDLSNESDVGNVSKIVNDKEVKSKKKPKEILKLKPENVKKEVAVDEKDKENVSTSGLEEGINDVVEDEDVSEEEDDDEDLEKKSGRKKVATSLHKKKISGGKMKNKGEVKGKLEAKEMKESGKNPKELPTTTIDTPSSPVTTSRERPTRERKVVERLVEVIEKEPNKSVIIEKGQGTPLKDIPNVAYKLARKKPVDLKFLHQTLFGRRGKLVDFKSHILQFSGFAWHETEEKQRARLKEKLDKCVKDDLLDLCDLLDLTVSRTSTKKEEIIVKLVDFLEAPHATTDVILSEKEQSKKSKKRKRSSGGSAPYSGGTSAKKSRTRKRLPKTEGRPNSKGRSPRDTKDDEEEDTKNFVPDEEDDAPRYSESDAKENESSDASDSKDKSEDDDEEYGKGKHDMVQSPEKQSPVIRERRTGSSSKKVSSQTEAKSLVKSAQSSNKQLKVKKDDNGEKVFTRRIKKESESPEASGDEGGSEDADHPGKRNQDIKQSPQKGSSASKKRKRTGSNSKKTSSQTVVNSPVKTAQSSKQSKAEKDDNGQKVFTRKKKDVDSPKKSNSKSVVKVNSSGKKSRKGKAASDEQRKSGPSKSDLRKTICETLKEVDFNTATFTDILKKLATHYKMDLTSKKAAIKQMIQEELTKMADEAEDSEEDEGEGEAEDAGKEESPKPASKKVKA